MTETDKQWLWHLPEGGAIGKRSIRRLDGYEKASGKAIYTRDIKLPGMLYAKQFVSPYAHAKIKSMDTSKAEALPGVRAILRYDDPVLKEELTEQQIQWTGGLCALLPGRADWQGQPMGVAVCADTEQICERALRLVEIKWEVLPFILDWEEALEPGAPILHPDLRPDSNLLWDDVQEFGNVAEGFAEADEIIEFREDCEEDVWAGVEGFVCVARWQGDYLEVWLHNQLPSAVQVHLASDDLAMNVPVNKCQVIVPYQGSLFGGLSWIWYNYIFPRLAVVLAKRTDRPVKMLYDGSLFHGSGQTLGVWNYRVGAKNDGTITAVEIRTLYSYTDITKVRESTRIPNIYFQRTVPFVSRGCQTCYKNGGPNCTMLTEINNHVAAKLGLDPTEVALKNDGANGHDMTWLSDYKQRLGFPDRDSLRECIEAGKKAIGWDEKWHAPGTKKLANGKMHGLGFTWCYEWNGEHLRSSVGMAIRPDGTVSIFMRHCESGVSGETTYAQIVADELGMKYEDVDHRPFNDVFFEGSEPSGSSGLVNIAPSMVRAAKEAKQKLLEMATTDVDYLPVMEMVATPIKAPFSGLKPEELDIKDSVIFEKANPENKCSVAELMGMYQWFVEGANQEYASKPIFTWAYNIPELRGVTYLCRQAYFLEVEVDTETGQVDIVKFACVNDVGKAINPEACNGQQYGGVYMGIGRSNTEQVQYDPQTGVKLNDNLIDYRFPSMNDCGPIDCILVETAMGYGPYGMVGIGEDPAAMLGTITSCAIYNAIGKWVDDFPTTPDKVLKALGKI